MFSAGRESWSDRRMKSGEEVIARATPMFCALAMPRLAGIATSSAPVARQEARSAATAAESEPLSTTVTASH